VSGSLSSFKTAKLVSASVLSDLNRIEGADNTVSPFHLSPPACPTPMPGQMYRSQSYGPGNSLLDPTLNNNLGDTPGTHTPLSIQISREGEEDDDNSAPSTPSALDGMDKFATYLEAALNASLKQDGVRLA